MLLAEYLFVKDLTSEILEGGPGSGHWGHKGRHGSRGGSLPGGNVSAHGIGQRRITSTQMGRYLSTRIQRGRYTDVRAAASRLRTRFPKQPEDRYGRALRKAGFTYDQVLTTVAVTPGQALSIARARPRPARSYSLAKARSTFGTAGTPSGVTQPTPQVANSAIREVWNSLGGAIGSAAREHGLRASPGVNAAGSAGYFSIRFNTADGSYAGRTEFSLDASSKSGYIGGFFMDSRHQGTGLGMNCINAIIKHAQSVGIRRIGLLANGGEGVGRYAWAVMGFDFKRDHEYESNRFKDWLRSRNIDPGDITFKHSWEIAAFEHNGNKVGKDYLMRHHGSYDAALDVTPGSKGLMAFQNYMSGRKMSEGKKVNKAA